MKKFFAIAAAAMMFSASAGTLTVFDGTLTDYEIPISSRFMDYSVYTHQVIYPEDQLTGLQGQDITAIKYFVSNEAGSTLNGGNVTMYIGTTDQSAFSVSYNNTTSFVDESNLTKVAAMAMTPGVNEIEFTFDEPWTYNGGNIVIQTVIDEDGSVVGSEATYFLGQEAGAASACGSWTIYAHNFAPKTTFTYDGGDTPEPELLRGDINNDKNVNISDVTALINLLLKGDVTVTVATDCNADGNANISDVTALINYLLKGQW